MLCIIIIIILFATPPLQDALLVMLDSDLRADPQNALDSVSTASGLDLLDVTPESSTSEALEAAFEELFPTFESTTGWRMEGNYDPMSAHVKRRLRQFYEPYNIALQHFLGRELHWET